MPHFCVIIISKKLVSYSQSWWHALFCKVWNGQSLDSSPNNRVDVSDGFVQIHLMIFYRYTSRFIPRYLILRFMSRYEQVYT